MYVCVCVCEREGGREGGREGEPELVVWFISRCWEAYIHTCTQHTQQPDLAEKIWGKAILMKFVPTFDG